MFKESVSQSCSKCNDEVQWQAKQAKTKAAYFCRSCWDTLLGGSGKTLPIAADLWLEDWYKKEKARLRNAKTT